MTGATLDPYAVLGVPPGAARDEVARAYRRLAKRFHPDVHPGPDAAERMRRINEAWEVLSRPVGRAPEDHVRPYHRAAAAPHWAPRPRPRYATSRPPRRAPVEPSFGDKPWVTAAVSAVLVLLFFVATYFGSLAP